MFKTAHAVRFGATLSLGVAVFTSSGPLSAQIAAKAVDDAAGNYAKQMLKDGRQIFRYDTFGSEGFWSNTLQLHTAIAGARTAASATACHQRPRSRSA